MPEEILRELTALRAEVRRLREELDALKGPAQEVVQAQLAEFAQTKVESTTRFPLKIFHNVFSLSGPQPFDLGLYRGGATRERQFTRPGTYRVFCNIHPHMTALVVVVVRVGAAAGSISSDGDVGTERARPRGGGERRGRGDGARNCPGRRAWSFVQHRNKDYPAAAYQRQVLALCPHRARTEQGQSVLRAGTEQIRRRGLSRTRRRRRWPRGWPRPRRATTR